MKWQDFFLDAIAITNHDNFPVFSHRTYLIYYVNEMAYATTWIKTATICVLTAISTLSARYPATADEFFWQPLRGIRSQA
jgi:hypothetical protein